MADPRHRPRIMAKPGAGPPTVKKLSHDRPRVLGGKPTHPVKKVAIPKRLG